MRPIALYLPQYHPIPENDAWWGRGFTEWTNVAKAKPLFRGHRQPHLPADLGFYDLRLPETRDAQAAMARAHGIEGFCYYHYWFAGRRILEQPFTEVLASGRPDFPFSLCWANQSWRGVWHGAPKATLIEQTYPGRDDHLAHFAALLPAFRDRRCLRVEGKPVFFVYRPREMPEPRAFTDLWRDAARRAGLPGLFLIGFETDGHRGWQPADHGYDGLVRSRLPALARWPTWAAPVRKITHKLRRVRRQLAGHAASDGDGPTIHRYGDLLDTIVEDPTDGLETYPCVIPNWDNTPRAGARGLVLQGSTPELFRAQLRKAVRVTAHLPAERRFVVLKSWNEWAEGNYLEPDLETGSRYLEVVRDEIGVVSPPTVLRRAVA